MYYKVNLYPGCGVELKTGYYEADSPEISKKRRFLNSKKETTNSYFSTVPNTVKKTDIFISSILESNQRTDIIGFIRSSATYSSRDRILISEMRRNGIRSAIPSLVILDFGTPTTLKVSATISSVRKSKIRKLLSIF